MRTNLARTAEEQKSVARHASAARETATPSQRVFQLQRLVGNQTVMRLMDAGHVAAPRLQAQLRVGPADDAYEREADRVADHVMRMPEPGAQRKCAACEDKDRIREATVAPGGDIQREAASAGGPAVAPPIVSEVLSESGHALDPDVRSFMEPRFGHDFSHVRVHTGSRAAASARAVNAVAYTVGRSVIFDEGAYRPGTEAGRSLIAHELTHVVQQSGATAVQRMCAKCEEEEEQ